MRFGWFSDLTPIERRTYCACLGAFSLDSMDSTIYALITPALITLVGLSKPEAGMLTTAALLGNLIGGWASGLLADRLGRVNLMKATILWVAVFTGLAAFASSYGALVSVRFLQGLGFGGEAAVGGVLVSEAVRANLRGRATSSLQSGYAIGYAMSTALMAILFRLFPEAVVWRVMLGIGIAPALLVFFIQRMVPETQVFKSAADSHGRGRKPEPFWAIFQRRYLRATLAGVVLAIGVFGAGFAMNAWLPTYLRLQLHLPITKTAGYLFMNILGSLTGPFIYGLLSDRIGRRSGFMTFIVGEVMVVSLFLFAPITAAETALLACFHGALQGGMAGGLPTAFSELFGTRVRASESGFCLSGGRGLGAVVPASVGILAETLPLSHAMGICALTALSIAFIAALVLPERTGAKFGEDHQ